MTERTVVTGGDAKYFPLIDELCASVRYFRDASQMGLVVIDGGLEAEQKTHLQARYGARILEVGWGFDIAPSRIRGRDHLKVQIARTFLDTYLPDTGLIAWIDGDAWIQDMAALDMMFDAAEKGPLCIVSQSSRYATQTMALRWGAFGYAEVRSILYKNARRAGVSEKEARIIGNKGTLNSGVFVLRQDAPHWQAWRARQQRVINRGRVFTSDQLSLGLAVYVDGLPVELAPEICNYMGPHWCCAEDESALVERYIPNAKVGIVHMAGYDEMRKDLAITAPIRTVDGRMVAKSLRRPAWVKD
jgi:hypothetical protein